MTCSFLSLRVVKMPMVQEGEIPFEMVWADLLEAGCHMAFEKVIYTVYSIQITKMI